MVYRITHTLTIQYTSSFLVDNLSLFIHYLVIFQKVLTDSKVIALNLLLRRLNRIRQHLMLDLFTVFHTKRVKHSHQTL